MTIETDTAAALAAGTEIADPHTLDPDFLYGVTLPEGARHELVDVERFADHPAAKRGTVRVYDAASFLAYYAKHSDEQSEVYADREAATVTAVLNAHEGGDGAPRWEDHRLTLVLRVTTPWRTWLGIDRKLMPQEQFAEHIEACLPDIVTPAAAEMLEIVQTISASTRGYWKSSTILATGEREATWSDEQQSAAGRTGSLTVPRAIELALAPYEGCDRYRLNARFRLRIDSGRLLLGVVLDRPEDVAAAAYEDIVGAIDKGVPVSIMRGTPAAARR